MSNPNDDTYAREVVRSIEHMSRQLVEFRQDITRAISPMYPRIVEIEKQLDAEAKERPARQAQLDQKLAQQNAVASQQGAALQQVASTVKAQGEVLEQQNKVLERIFKRQFWGRVAEGALIVAGMAFIYWLLR